MGVGPLHLSVVVPAFNEDQNLAIVVEQTVGALDQAKIGPFEIVIVDDGSTDATGRVADGLSAQYPQVKVVHHLRNRGFGAAMQSGYAVSTGTYVTQIPADGEITIGEALNLLQGIGDHDVIASRRERGAIAHRDLLTRLLHVLLSMFLGFDGSGLDGIFVIRRSVLNDLPLRSATGLINLETLMRCTRRRCSMTTGVVHVSPRLSGRSKVTNPARMVKTFLEILKLRLALTFESK